MKIDPLFRPAPGPLTDILLGWDRGAIEKKLWDKRKTIWEILDLFSGLKRDRGALVAELQKWKQTPEVERIIEWIKK